MLVTQCGVGDDRLTAQEKGRKKDNKREKKGDNSDILHHIVPLFITSEKQVFFVSVFSP